MRKTFCLLLICVLSSCSAPSNRSLIQKELPAGLTLESRQFAISKGQMIECYVVGGGEGGKWPYAIFKNGQLAKIVESPQSYQNDQLIKEPAVNRVERTLRQPPIKVEPRKPGGDAERDSGREPMNILPAFLPIAPFLIMDTINEKRFSNISLGDSTDSLPQRWRWRTRGDFLVNYDLGAAVKVSNGRIVEIFEGDFFHCQF